MNIKTKGKLYLLISLLVIIISGYIGYGVYSYYYTTAVVRNEPDIIQVPAFNPTIYYSGSDYFLYGNHYGVNEISCYPNDYDAENKIGYYNCTSGISVFNGGDNPIIVEAYDVVGHCTNCDYSTIQITCNEGSCNNNNVAYPSNNIYIGFSTIITVHNLNDDPTVPGDSNETVLTAPVFGDEFSFYITYKLDASEEHGE